jgi:hypothetical protein
MHFQVVSGSSFDALYRRFHYDALQILVDTIVNSTAANAWEFPILVGHKTPD